MKMLVGLGNPGRKYQGTRHNLGYAVIDELAGKLNLELKREKKQARYAAVTIKGEKVLLVKPLTFMNSCGEAIAPLRKYYDIDMEDILVVYDDLDLPCGKIRLRYDGSSAGHNGLKSLIACLGSQDFKRIRIGIDKDPQMVTADYVLGKPDRKQRVLLKEAVKQAAAAAADYLEHDFAYVMNKYNKNG